MHAPMQERSLNGTLHAPIINKEQPDQVMHVIADDRRRALQDGTAENGLQLMQGAQIQPDIQTPHNTGPMAQQQGLHGGDAPMQLHCLNTPIGNVQTSIMNVRYIIRMKSFLY